MIESICTMEYHYLGLTVQIPYCKVCLRQFRCLRLERPEDVFAVHKVLSKAESSFLNQSQVSVVPAFRAFVWFCLLRTQLTHICEQFLEFASVTIFATCLEKNCDKN